MCRGIYDGDAGDPFPVADGGDCADIHTNGHVLCVIGRLSGCQAEKRLHRHDHNGIR